MVWDEEQKVIYGNSPIGVKIEYHLPDSLRWKIQLWTFKDCLKFCRKELSDDTSGMTLQRIEPIMIRKLSPALNIMCNLNPGKDTTPKSRREKELEQRLDAAYDEIFNKRR